MSDENSLRKKNLQCLLTPTDEQRFELFLMTVKERSSDAEYRKYVDDYLEKVDPATLLVSLYDHNQLVAVGYTLDEIVDKGVSLSADAILGYETKEHENVYWMEHRRNSKSLYVCAMHAGIMLGHFSITPVLSAEALEFLKNERTETGFTIVPAADLEKKSHYLYISAVVIRPVFRDSVIATRIIRRGHRLVSRHLASKPFACGCFAEAYSPSGRRLCELFSMHNIEGNFFIKKSECMDDNQV